MNLAGLALCARYSYPPNSLFLCGLDRQEDLKWYSTHQQGDKGTIEILSCFSTLYPYLTLIAHENDIADPFDKRVVEAYWLGNDLLYQIPISSFVSHLDEILKLRKKIKRKELEIILDKVSSGALPCHSFHVLNVGRRTGHLNLPYTLETMDACLINWGKVKRINFNSITVETKPLKLLNSKLEFGHPIQRILMFQGEKDVLSTQLTIGDFISYHWGYFCQRLTKAQLNNLIFYTQLAIKLSNRL